MSSSCGAGEDSWKSLGQQGDQTSQPQGRSTLNILWKDWCWSWSSSILVIWCKQMTQWKSPWCWERLRAEGEEGVRGWDGWTASLMQWAWAWAKSGRWWGTGRPGVLQSMGLQRVRHDWATKRQKIHVDALAPVWWYMELGPLALLIRFKWGPDGAACMTGLVSFWGQTPTSCSLSCCVRTQRGREPSPGDHIGWHLHSGLPCLQNGKK